jgi:hypothetical protein
MLRIRWGIAVVLAFVASFPLAAETVQVHSQVTGVHGNLCEPTVDNPSGYCYGPVLAGGWPFPFLADDWGVSVRNSLDFPEDDLDLRWYLADVATFEAMFTATFAVVGVVGHALRLTLGPR